MFLLILFFLFPFYFALTKRIRTEVTGTQRKKRQTHLLQTGGVELRLIDDLYSHLVAKKEEAPVSLSLHICAPVTPVIATCPDAGGKAAQLSLLHTYKHTARRQRGLRGKKKGKGTQSRKWQIKKKIIKRNTQPQIRQGAEVA